MKLAEPITEISTGNRETLPAGRSLLMLTEKEKDSIRFYQGDTRKRTEDGSLSNSLTETGLYGIPSAYKTMNCLMFDGIDNEKERISEGSTVLNPQVFHEIEKVVDIFCDIFRAMCKCKNRNRKIIVYRTDRRISVREMKKLGQTISFTSTSKGNHPKEYFCKKKMLMLLEFIVPAGIPYLDFEEVLGDNYYYADQKEILLPPFLNLVFYEGKLTAEEDAYRDADNQPPQGKCIVVLEGLSLPTQKRTDQDDISGLQCLTRGKAKMAEILARMIAQEELSQQEVQEYCAWKANFREIVIAKFCKIQSEYKYIETDDSFQSRKHLLMEDVKKLTEEFDSRRKDYKNHVKWCSIALAVASVVPMVCVTLSFIAEIEIYMKIAAILTSATAMILTRIMKIEAYYFKLNQRTKTCLRLRDLARKMKYEDHWDEQTLESYVESLRTIIKEDTDMSLQNLQLQISNGEELFQTEITS